MPREYRHIQEYEREIIELYEKGLTLREIGEKFGFTYKQMREFKTRYNRKQKKLAAGIPTKPKGRPRVRPLTTTEEYEHEIAKLRMENKLLRDFLQSTERM